MISRLYAVAMRCDRGTYYSLSTEQCEPCTSLCISPASVNECAQRCPDFSLATTASTTVTTVPTTTDGTGTSHYDDTLWIKLTVAGVTISVIAIAVIVWLCLVRARRHRWLRNKPQQETIPLQVVDQGGMSVVVDHHPDYIPGQCAQPSPVAGGTCLVTNAHHPCDGSACRAV